MFAMFKSGRSMVSPPLNPTSAAQTLPPESVNGVEDPALMRTTLPADGGTVPAGVARGAGCVAAAAGVARPLVVSVLFDRHPATKSATELMNNVGASKIDVLFFK